MSVVYVYWSESFPSQDANALHQQDTNALMTKFLRPVLASRPKPTHLKLGRGFASQTIYPHLPVPYIFGIKIYCQLGAWFQIYRELEDERRNTYTYKSLILGRVKDHIQL